MRNSFHVIGIAIALGLIICVGAFLLMATVLVLTVGGIQSAVVVSTPMVVRQLSPAYPTPTPFPLPTVAPFPASPAPPPPSDDPELAMEATLAAIDLSPRDPVALAIALRGIDPQDISLPGGPSPRDYEIGDREQFWITNNDTRESRQIEAELVAEAEHIYMWLDTTASARLPNGQTAGPSDFLAAAERFEDSYRILRDVFGEEPSPGVDGDTHLYVLNSGDLGAVGGYFSADDQLPTLVNPMSNAHEMFYISTWGAGGVNGTYYNKTLAHEFQHMIHSMLDPNEGTWLNEGMSELAQQLAGFSGEDYVGDYLLNTEIQLTTWPPEDYTYPYYGGAFLFAEYLYERFGVDFIANLAGDPRNGLASLDATLADFGYEGNADDIFDDWSIAIALDDPTFAGGRYGFENVTVDSRPSAAAVVYAPWDHEGTLNQYGFDYIRLYDQGEIQVTFEGDQIAHIVPVDPYSGDWMWWSNMGDYSTMTLTREIDLSNVDEATLTFWTWYNIEFEWDYAYVMASIDGGQTWETLETSVSTDYNPTGNNLGNGITGASEEWIQVMVNLDGYTGRVIMLRFALITDDSAHLEHMVIDRIAIPEVILDDAESGENGWEADGFVRINNRLPQHWSVQAVVLTDTPEIYPVTIGDDNTGSLSLTIPPDANGAYLIVSPRTRNTLMPASYSVTFAR